MQTDRGLLRDRLSHKHHRPEAVHVSRLRASPLHVPGRVALDHRGVHAGALPHRQLPAQIEHNRKALVGQAIRLLYTHSELRDLAVRAHSHGHRTRAYSTQKDLLHEQQELVAFFQESPAEQPLLPAEVLQEDLRRPRRIPRRVFVLHVLLHVHDHHFASMHRQLVQYDAHYTLVQVNGQMDECQAQNARSGDVLQRVARQKSPNRELEDHVDSGHHFPLVYTAHAAPPGLLLHNQREAGQELLGVCDPQDHRALLHIQSQLEYTAVCGHTQEFSASAQAEAGLWLL